MQELPLLITDLNNSLAKQFQQQLHTQNNPNLANSYTNQPIKNNRLKVNKYENSFKKKHKPTGKASNKYQKDNIFNYDQCKQETKTGKK